MILRGLREKSNQKRINKLLNLRKPSFNDTKIESIGVILNSSEFNNFEAFRDFAKELKIHPNKIKIFAFTEDEDLAASSRELVFSTKEIGWKGKVKNNELQDFLNKDFDALLGYYNEDIIELNLITAMSNARFKIGIAAHDERLFDLIIATETKNFEIFKTELKKYLNILKRIK